MSSFISFRAAFNVRASVLLLLAGLVTPAAVADTFVGAYPYAVTSPRGGYVFKMIPDTDELSRRTETPSGSGTAYAVKSDGQLVEMWKTSGWYSRKVFLGTDGRTLVRMGPWNIGKEPAPDHLAVAFYRDGKLLKSYSTAELIKDRSRISVSSSHYEWLAVMGSFAPGIGGDEFGLWLNEGDHTFTLTTIDDRRYRFDTNTGEIKQVEPNVRALMSWASPEDLERLIVSFAVAEFPMPSVKARATLGLPARMALMWSSTDADFSEETSYSAITNPSDPNGYYAVRENSKRSPGAPASATAEVVAMDLVFESASGTTFVVGPDKFSPAQLVRMKADRKARNQTPKEFSEAYIKATGEARRGR